MGECSGRSRVGKVIGRNVNGLYRCDRTLVCGGDTLLERAHFGRQRRLITNGGRHTSKQRGNLRTCLCKSEYVIYEQQYVLTFSVTEILCHCKSGKTYAHSRSGRFVHLTVNERGLVDNSGLLHLVVKVVTLTGTLADARKYGQTAVLLCNIVDELHDKNGLADAGTAEKSYLTALEVRRDKVNYLDARFEYLVGSSLLLVGRRLSVDFPALLCFGGWHIINGLSEKVEYSSESLFTYGNGDRLSRIDSLCASYKSVGRTHSYAANDIVADMLCDFDNEALSVIVDLNGVLQVRQRVRRKADIKYRADDLNDRTDVFFSHFMQISFQPPRQQTYLS